MTPSDPTTVLDAYEESGDSARRRELATYLGDLAKGGEVDLRPLLDRVRRLRSSEVDLEARALLRKVVHELETQQLGIVHDSGLGRLTADRKKEIERTLVELDTLFVSQDDRGRSLDDVYEFVQLAAVDSGGFGEIYKMRRRSDGLLVAVKFLKGQWSSHAQAKARFDRESVALQDVADRGGHPNLLPWIDHGTDGQRAFLVTEWADGGNLWDRYLESPQGLPLDVGCRWLTEVLHGLKALHGWKFLHRDIKPTNLYLAKDDGPVWIGDFGIVLPLRDSRLTREGGASPGTTAYAPPEQCLGLDQDERTDLFAWASTAFELLCGVRAEPTAFGESVRTYRPEIPEAWDRALSVCRAERMSGRPRNVDEVLRILEG